MTGLEPVIFRVSDGCRKPTWQHHNIIFHAKCYSSFGQRIFGLRVQDINTQQKPRLIQSLIRTLLIILVFPPLLSTASGRGLHDRIAKTQIISV